MRKLRLLPAIAVFVPALALAQVNYEIALIGDMPYGTAANPTGLDAAYERVIADINQYNPYFTAHIGDTKSGSTRCDDSHYTKVLNWFNSFETGLLYSVGDNEWTDCLRANNGGYDPLDRLALVRRTYFSTSMTLGKRPLPVMRQSDEAGFALYRENAMLVRWPAVFVTLHIPGSNNNLEYVSVQGAPNPFYDNGREYAARNAANVAWLRKAFQVAKDNGLKGLMVLTQANMFETYLDPSTGSTHSGFVDTIKVLREETAKFDGEVVLVHGDTHYMRVDKPLTDIYPACASAEGDCKPIDPAGVRQFKFTRVEVPGQNDVHWVRCRVRANARNVFSFEFQIVPENR